MDYRCITNTDSAQYKFLHDGNVVFSDGLLYYDGAVCIAVGSRYGYVGCKLKLTFEDGRTLIAFKADQKSDKDTLYGCHHISDGSLVEVLIDGDNFRNCHSYEYMMGDLNSLPMFNGNIINIEVM